MSEKKMDTPIWRYLDFPKFLDWVASHEMYFARADKFDDRWECVIPDVALRPLLESFNANGFDQDRIQRIIKQYDLINPLRRTHSFVSSWYRSEEESDLMWRAYSQRGLVVKSTPQMVIDSLAVDQSLSIFVKAEEVHYYNPDELDSTRDSTIDVVERILQAPILAKRNVFKDDKELRFFIEWNETPDSDLGRVAPPEKCLRIECKLQTCFKEIVLSPGLQNYHLEAIRTLVKGYGLDPAIVRLSKIDEQFNELIDRNAART